MKNVHEHRLSGRHYLISVIGFSSVPRLITSVLSLVSFPIVVRAVGASEYGVFVYVSAMLNLSVLLADFGVAAASGKAIAEARMRGGDAARKELKRCVRLQALVGAAGLVPMIGISWFIVAGSKTMVVAPIFLLTMVFATWLAVGAAFVRSCLQSYLAFGWLAVLDTVESSIRTATWLCVAWFWPTNAGLAWATLITAVVTGVLGTTILLTRARRTLITLDPADMATDDRRSNRSLIADSAHFLGIGLATRVFLSVPLIMFGQILGAEVVGVIGAFTRLLDMVSFPFITIGNALAVKAYEVKAAGTSAVVALWNASFRFIAVAAGLAGGALLSADLIARAVIPETPAAGTLFALLSIMIVTHSTSCFITPMSDYVGGLQRRMIFLGALALVQIPVLWMAARHWGSLGAVMGYTVGNVAMIVGYVLIAKRVFFGAKSYFPPSYVLKSFGVIALSILVVLIARPNLDSAATILPGGSLIAPLAYALLLAIAFISFRELRERFLSLSVFEFTRT